MKIRSLYNLARKTITLSTLFALPVLLLGPSAASAATGTLSTTEAQSFTAAAKEFQVPEPVLLALSYNETRWESPTGMSADGGYGPMDLRTSVQQVVSGRDGSTKTPAQHDASYYTLDRAANLLHVSASQLRTDTNTNIRGAAAVLADEARQLNHGSLPTNISNWYGAVAAYGGATDTQTAGTFADDVYATIKQGVLRTTSIGQSLSLPAMTGIVPNKALVGLVPNLQGATPGIPGQQPECPAHLNCRFIAAAYAQDDPNDPTNYGNFDYAHRPADMQIKYIYIHDTEGSYDSAISHFQDPTAYDSAQYVIRSSDGAITQMVPNADVSWGVGNWYMNMHGINIEHEGFGAQGASWYTEAMYQSSATLVRWLAAKYHIPLDRQHILGHGDLPRLPAGRQAVQHWDPGPYWDWNHYMALLHGQSDQSEASADGGNLTTPLHTGQSITIDPRFVTNQPPIQNCGIIGTDPCEPEPSQGSNIVYLHTQASASAPLLSDPYLHTDGSPGTTRINDWSATAVAGEKYVVAATQGDWTGIWFAGQIGWLYNPHGASQTAHATWSATVTPRAGLSSIPVYAGAYPEASAYPSTIPAQPVTPVYTMAAGQQYTTTAEQLPTDYFYDATINYSKPDDHAIVRGTTRYYQIMYNHHIGFVKASDVTLR